MGGLSWLAVRGFLKAYGLQIVLLVAVLGGMWYLDHRGYQRAQKEQQLKNAQTAALTAALNQAISNNRSQFEQAMESMVRAHDQQLLNKLNSLDIIERTVVQPTLVREIASAPRLTDPNAGITDGMLRVLNTARSSSWPSGSCVTRADGSTSCALPPARPNPGQDNRNPR